MSDRMLNYTNSRLFGGSSTNGKKKLINLLFILIIIGVLAYLGSVWYQDSSSGQASMLTQEEWLWLTENPQKLVIANSGEHPPFFYLNRKGQWIGLAFDYLSIIEKRLGCQFRHVSFDDEAAMLAAIKNNEIAFIIDAESTVADYVDLLHTEYVSAPYAVYIQGGRRVQRSYQLDALKGMEIAVTKNSSIHHYIRQNFPDLSLFLVDNDLAALLRLASGNSDAAIINQGTAAYYFDELRLEDLQQAAVVDLNLRMNYGVRANMPELHRILSKSMTGIGVDYREKTTARWLKQQPVSLLASPRVRRAILGTALGFALLIAAFYTWNIMLRRQVARQTSALQNALEIRYEMERQLLQSSKVEALGTLASGVAHDFNNMLTAIIGYAESHHPKAQTGNIGLDYVMLDPQERIDKIRGVARRAQEIVQRILSFARSRELEPTPISATAAIQDFLNFADGLFPKTLQIKKQFDATEDIVWADPAFITQIMINLVGNASDAMQGKGRIIIKTKSIHLNENDFSESKAGFCLPCLAGDYFCLIVQDHGPGIPEDVQARMFEAFYTTKDVNQGTGMGLPIVRDIVRRLGGSLYVESNNRGTMFEILLPLFQKQAEPAEKASHDTPSTPPAKPESQTEAETSPRQPTVLFVDDDEDFRCRAADILFKLGCKVVTRASPEDALKSIADGAIRDIDLVISDYVMPGMSGLDLAIRLRQCIPDLPVILCSGREDLVRRTDWEKAGIREFCAKPMKIRDFARIMRHCRVKGVVNG